MPRRARTAASPARRVATCSTATSSRRRRAVAWRPVNDFGSRRLEVADLAEPVGFVGLGIMGSRMAACLARAGHPVAVYNRTAAKAEAFVAEHGGRVASSPRDAADGAAAVITMVVDGAQVEEVLLGADGAVGGAAPGTLFVDCSTIAPADVRRIGATLDERGMAFVDAPVSGSSPKAETGTLTIMAGGSEQDFDRARPFFDA